MQLQKQIAADVNHALIGRTVKVLIERKQDDVYIGRTQHDAPDVDGVVFVRRKGLKPGTFYTVKVIDALEKLDAGADLIQLYTGFIYEGPQLIKSINKALLKKKRVD